MSRIGITSARVARVLVVGAAVALVGFGGSACGLLGGGVSKEALSEKFQEDLSADAELKSLPESQRKRFADCTAGVLLKHGNKDDLQLYIDGTVKADDIRGMKGKAAEDEAKACALEAVAK